MAKTKRKRQKTESAHITACVKNFNVSSSSSLNYEIYDIDRCRDETPIIRYDTSLEVFGECLEPGDRKGHEIKITVVGDDKARWFTQLTLADYLRRDSNGRPIFKQRRGMERPVYDLPDGMCILDKVRGEPRWSTYIWASSNFAMQWIALLNTISPLYLQLHEKRKQRQRWLSSIELVSSNPLEE